MSVLIALLIPGAIGLVVSVIVAWAAVLLAEVPRSPEDVWKREPTNPESPWLGDVIKERYRRASTLWVEEYPGLTIYRAWFDGPPFEELTYRAGFPFRCLEGRTFGSVNHAVQGSLHNVDPSWQDRLGQGISLPSSTSAIPFGVGLPGQTVSRALPVIPRWPQLLLNVILFGGAWWLLISLASTARRTRRRRRACCALCGHPLAGNVRCTECGAPSEALRRDGFGIRAALAGRASRRMLRRALLVAGAISLGLGFVLTVVVAVCIAWWAAQPSTLELRGFGVGHVGSVPQIWSVTLRGSVGVERVVVERYRYRAHSEERDGASTGAPPESLVPSWIALSDMPRRDDGTGGFMVACAVGWPWSALCGSVELIDDALHRVERVEVHDALVFESTPISWDGLRQARIIPLRPRWIGIAIDTLFYGGVIWSTFALVVLARSRRASGSREAA